MLYRSYAVPCFLYVPKMSLNLYVGSKRLVEHIKIVRAILGGALSGFRCLGLVIISFKQTTFAWCTTGPFEIAQRIYALERHCSTTTLAPFAKPVVRPENLWQHERETSPMLCKFFGSILIRLCHVKIKLRCHYQQRRHIICIPQVFCSFFRRLSYFIFYPPLYSVAKICRLLVIVVTKHNRTYALGYNILVEKICHLSTPKYLRHILYIVKVVLYTVQTITSSRKVEQIQFL